MLNVWAVNEVYRVSEEVRLVYLFDTEDLAREVVKRFNAELVEFQQKHNTLAGVFYEAQEIAVFDNINDIPA